MGQLLTLVIPKYNKVKRTIKNTIVLYFKQPQNTYVIEATKTVDHEMLLYHFDVQAPDINIAWRKADLLAEAHFMESWLVWRKERPESLRK